MFRPWSRAEDRFLALKPLGDVPFGKHADEPRAPLSIRSMRQYRTTGRGTGSRKSNYAGEARKNIFELRHRNRGSEGCWLTGLSLGFMGVDVIDGAQQGNDFRQYTGIWMAYIGTSAAWGSGVGFSRITGAAGLNDRYSQREVHT